jgi:hypothetical protein
VLNSGQAGICNTYLASKAYGYFGSTTIAYGPAEGNGAADLICQFFLRRVLAGASLGRAALEARQQFATQAPELDPTDLKTLVQFNLLGDPSLYPVVVETPQHAVARTPAEKGIPPFALSLAVDRASRRQQLMSRGLWIAKNQPVARRVDEPTKTAKAQTRGLKASKARAAHADRSTLKKLISDAGLESATTQSYIVAPKAAPKPKASTTKAAAKAPPPVRMHVVLGKRAENEAGLNAVTPDGVTRTIALIAKEVNGKILSYRELYGK